MRPNRQSTVSDSDSCFLFLFRVVSVLCFLFVSGVLSVSVKVPLRLLGEVFSPVGETWTEVCLEVVSVLSMSVMIPSHFTFFDL